MEPRLYMHFSPKIVPTVQLNSPSQDNNKHWFCAIIWASLFQKINDEKWQIITFIASFHFRKYSRIFRSFNIRNMHTATHSMYEFHRDNWTVRSTRGCIVRRTMYDDNRWSGAVRRIHHRGRRTCRHARGPDVLSDVAGCGSWQPSRDDGA